MGVLPGCIADDFTGVTDFAGLIARSGVPWCITHTDEIKLCGQVCLLVNRGPVVAGKDSKAACNAVEELEDTTRLAMLTRGHDISSLTTQQVQAVVKQFDVEWKD